MVLFGWFVGEEVGEGIMREYLHCTFFVSPLFQIWSCDRTTCIIEPRACVLSEDIVGAFAVGLSYWFCKAVYVSSSDSVLWIWMIFDIFKSVLSWTNERKSYNLARCG